MFLRTYEALIETLEYLVDKGILKNESNIPEVMHQLLESICTCGNRPDYPSAARKVEALVPGYSWNSGAPVHLFELFRKRS